MKKSQSAADARNVLKARRLDGKIDLGGCAMVGEYSGVQASACPLRQ